MLLHNFSALLPNPQSLIPNPQSPLRDFLKKVTTIAYLYVVFQVKLRLRTVGLPIQQLAKKQILLLIEII